MREMPTLASASYQSSALDTTRLLAPMGIVQQGQRFGVDPGVWQDIDAIELERQRKMLNLPRAAAILKETATIKETPMPNARIVKVFIADTDENVPLDRRLLYKGDEQFTDLTDQELFFEIPVSTMLVEHNKRRQTLTKRVGEKDVPLEPIRIRDLKRVVVNVASF
jgi:hypothetical protein